jgi:hypothetical protein
MLSPSSIAFRRTAGPLIRQLSTSTKIHRLRSFSPQTSTDTKFAIRRQVGTQEQELQVRKIDQNLLIRKFARPVEKIQLIRRVFAGKEDKQGVEVETAAEKVPQADMSEMQKIHTDKAFPGTVPFSFYTYRRRSWLTDLLSRRALRTFPPSPLLSLNDPY